MGSAFGTVPDAVIPQPNYSLPVELLSGLKNVSDGEGSIAMEIISKIACKVSYYRLRHAAGG